MQHGEQKPRLTIVLPFKLPTWNALFAMNPWERQRLTNWIKNFVYSSIQGAGGSQTPTGSVLRPRLTALQRAEYLLMIVPNTSKAFLSRRSKRKKIKQ